MWYRKPVVVNHHTVIAVMTYCNVFFVVEQTMEVYTYRYSKRVTVVRSARYEKMPIEPNDWMRSPSGKTVSYGTIGYTESNGQGGREVPFCKIFIEKCVDTARREYRNSRCSRHCRGRTSDATIAAPTHHSCISAPFFFKISFVCFVFSFCFSFCFSIVFDCFFFFCCWLLLLLL